MRTVALVSAAWLWSGAAVAGSVLEAETVASRFSGGFVADPAAGPEAPSGRLHALMVPVTVPALPGRTIYLQWRDGGPDGKVTRQRLWSFVEVPGGGARMKFFGFRSPADWVDAQLRPDRMAMLTLEDLVAYPEQCDLPWREIDGAPEAAIPAGCRIVTQRTQRTMELSAVIRVTPEGFAYREAGRLDDGTVVFQLPPDGDYLFRRQ